MRSKTLLAALVVISLIAMSLPVMAQAPTADFKADKTYGRAPLNVQFTATYITGSPTSYFWKFEPATSSDWNSHHFGSAVHTFRYPGVYDVSLTVSNNKGSTTNMKQNYITVVE
jgi:PKD repeat protein